VDVELDRRLPVALTVAAEAGALALSYFERREQLVVEHKGPQDLVTAADREVETLIRARFGAAFPEDGVLGEEHGGTAAHTLWVVDPIDGTTNFVHGLPHWGVAIAFVREGRCELGVIVVPVLQETFVARLGHGATCNGRPIAASRCTTLDRALVAFGSNKRNPLPPYLERLGRVLSAGSEYRRMGSAACNLSSVACGRLDAYFEQHLSSWDALAGMLLVSEAGGRCNDYLRGDALMKGNPVLVSGAALYDALAALTQL
jgi:myo-inositol-1(or 4)-monophosphatase